MFELKNLFLNVYR